ncbi:MAG TPA: hypothetical protein VLS27_14250 [Gammaproteobacteria bacterium]|nr:hypothetical protein [Gammaproteobacteria bacterium]
MSESYRGEPSSAGAHARDASPPPVTVDSRTGERLIALLLAGIIAWTYPVLFLISADASVFGIPLLYLYLYLSWGLFVGLVALIIEWRGAIGSPRTPRERKLED